MPFFKVNIITGIFFFLIGCSNNSDILKREMSTKDTSLNGLYVGIEELCWTQSLDSIECNSDLENPEVKWFHLSYLKIRNDSAFLDQSPITIFKNDTMHSASDGAFYYYQGTITKDSIISFNFQEVYCDYCMEQYRTKPDGTKEIIRRNKQWRGAVLEGGIIINGHLFSRIDKIDDVRKTNLMSEHPERYIR